MTDETRFPMNDEQMRDELLGLLKVNTMTDALRVVREMADKQPLVWLRPDGNLGVASLTVRQVVQVIGVLEGLTVK